MQFVTKPVVIEAIKFTGDNLEEIWEKFGENGISYEGSPDHPQHLTLWTADGNEIPCSPGMWVVKDSKPDTFYPCNDEHFQMKYTEYTGPVAELTLTFKYPIQTENYPPGLSPEEMVEMDIEELKSGSFSVDDLLDDEFSSITGRVL